MFDRRSKITDRLSDIIDGHSHSSGARSDISGARAPISGAHFYRSGVVPEVYDHLRVRSDRVAASVARLIWRSEAVPEQDGHVPDCVGEVPDRVDRVKTCSGHVHACVGDVRRCVGYVPNLYDGVRDVCDVLRECVAHVQTCDGAEIFLNRPIITRALSISQTGETPIFILLRGSTVTRKRISPGRLDLARSTQEIFRPARR